MKNRPIMILLITGILLISMISACNSDRTETNNDSLTDSFIALGYENCFICHTGGKTPINHHCRYFSSELIVDDCMICHQEFHNNKNSNLPIEVNYDCKLCHEY